MKFQHQPMGAIILRILGGLILAAGGAAFVLKTEWLMENVGRIEWAEQHLATSGGSRIFYKLLGVILVFFGFIVMTGMTQGLLRGTIGRLLVPS